MATLGQPLVINIANPPLNTWNNLPVPLTVTGTTGDDFTQGTPNVMNAMLSYNGGGPMTMPGNRLLPGQLPGGSTWGFQWNNPPTDVWFCIYIFGVRNGYDDVGGECANGFCPQMLQPPPPPPQGFMVEERFEEVLETRSVEVPGKPPVKKTKKPKPKPKPKAKAKKPAPKLKKKKK